MALTPLPILGFGRGATKLCKSYCPRCAQCDRTDSWTCFARLLWLSYRWDFKPCNFGIAGVASCLRIDFFQPLSFVGLFAPHSAFALDWEIERNFRYFLYPSNMAAQRVARDLYIVQKGATPTPEQLENLMNGGGFWKAKLGVVGGLRKRWPIGWPRDDNATPYQVAGQLRAQEGRPPPASEQELDRRGWAILLVRERSSARPHEATLTGSTETCWNPVRRLHSGCAVWGDYVRRPGWIVRVFDPDATPGQSCQWSLAGGVIAETDASQFVAATQRALQAGRQRSLAIAARSASSFLRIRPKLRRSLVR
jgi:hypothetical protein